MSIINNKYDILKKICNEGIVAVIRADSSKRAEKAAEACIEGGIKLIEITFTTPDAHKAINNLTVNTHKEEIVVGAGTVLDSETARIALMSGAKFIVSPVFNKETAKMCNRYCVPYIPGCMTISEITEAVEYGADIIKLFPGNVFAPSMVKAIKGPLPHVSIMPSGGVNLDNISHWIRNGCPAVSVGGSLTKGIEKDNYEIVTERAAKFVEKLKEARSEG